MDHECEERDQGKVAEGDEVLAVFLGGDDCCIESEKEEESSVHDREHVPPEARSTGGEDEDEQREHGHGKEVCALRLPPVRFEP